MFEIRTSNKGRISSSQTYFESWQIPRTSAVAKTLVFMWQEKFQDRFTNIKDGSRLGQSKIVVANGYIAAVACLIKRDTRFTCTVSNIANSVGISSGLAHKSLTQELKLCKVCAQCAPIV